MVVFTQFWASCVVYSKGSELSQIVAGKFFFVGPIVSGASASYCAGADLVTVCL